MYLRHILSFTSHTSACLHMTSKITGYKCVKKINVYYAITHIPVCRILNNAYMVKLFFTFTWLCRLICMNPFARSRVTHSCWCWSVMVQIMQMVIVTAMLDHMHMSLLCVIDVHVCVLPREEAATAQYIIYHNKCCTNLIYIITYMLHGHICAICAAVCMCCGYFYELYRI